MKFYQSRPFDYESNSGRVLQQNASQVEQLEKNISQVKREADKAGQDASIMNMPLSRIVSAIQKFIYKRTAYANANFPTCKYINLKRFVETFDDDIVLDAQFAIGQALIRITSAEAHAKRLIVRINNIHRISTLNNMMTRLNPIIERKRNIARLVERAIMRYRPDEKISTLIEKINILVEVITSSGQIEITEETAAQIRKTISNDPSYDTGYDTYILQRCILNNRICIANIMKDAHKFKKKCAKVNQMIANLDRMIAVVLERNPFALQN